MKLLVYGLLFATGCSLAQAGDIIFHNDTNQRILVTNPLGKTFLVPVGAQRTLVGGLECESVLEILTESSTEADEFGVEYFITQESPTEIAFTLYASDLEKLGHKSLGLQNGEDTGCEAGHFITVIKKPDLSMLAPENMCFNCPELS